MFKQRDYSASPYSFAQSDSDNSYLQLNVDTERFSKLVNAINGPEDL